VKDSFARAVRREKAVMDVKAQIHITDDEAGTLELAAEFARTLVRGDVVALVGDLGAGKTVFAKGIAAALGVRGSVTSPTFTLIQEYPGIMPLYHMDLYRLCNEDEIYGIGAEDYFWGDGVSVVEWAEKLGDRLPAHAVVVTITHLGPERRGIEIRRAIRETAAPAEEDMR
jgi:tRNA threonylcarbamoyladenosine biosynthesis protein TsaE